jgi:prolyl-tRNA editing enzyme YbaK/EbsC (Cys-tRNA(Pro) deacylase)
MPILDAIRALLNESGAVYREVRHAPTLTSEDSARERGEDLQIGGKALLLKVNDTFKLFVLSAAKQLDSGAIKERFGAKKTRFATPEELRELTGLVPGSVPPFGRPILPFDLYADESVVENEKIAFNAGSLTDSVIMLVRDYREIARPEVFRFSKVK